MTCGGKKMPTHIPNLLILGMYKKLDVLQKVKKNTGPDPTDRAALLQVPANGLAATTCGGENPVFHGAGESIPTKLLKVDKYYCTGSLSILCFTNQIRPCKPKLIVPRKQIPRYCSKMNCTASIRSSIVLSA